MRLLILLLLLHIASSFVRINVLSTSRSSVAQNAAVNSVENRMSKLPSTLRSLELNNLRGERIKLNTLMKEKSVVIFLRHLGLVIRIITLTC